MSPLFLSLVPAAFVVGFYVNAYLSKGSPMPAYPEISDKLTALEASVSELPARVAAKIAAGDPQAVQDKADTIADVQTRVGAVIDSLNSIAV